jgi:hypothetical protein
MYRSRRVIAQCILFNLGETPMILVSKHSFHDLVIRLLICTLMSFLIVTGGRNEFLVRATAE